MTALLLVGLLAAPPPAIAVLPPVTDQPGTEWLGMSIADEVEAQLIEYSSYISSKNAEHTSPLSVFGWRQTRSAARQAGIDTAVLMSATDGKRLSKSLGATGVLSAMYWLKSDSVRVVWRLLGAKEGPKHELEIPLEDLGRGAHKIFGGVIVELGLAVAGVPLTTTEPMPIAAWQAYGGALSILGEQSLDPRAKLVLTPERIAEAIRGLDVVTTGAPDFARPWAYRAVLNVMAGDPTRAKSDIEKAKQVGEAEAASVAVALFYMHYRGGNVKAAVVELGTSLNTHLGFLLGLGYLGEAYLQAELPNEAGRIFTIYVERVPGNAWAGSMLAECLSRAGKHRQAIDKMQALLKRFPEALVVQSGLAARQIDGGQLTDARKTLDKALKAFPDQPRLLAHLARVEIASGNVDAASVLGKKAAERADDSRGEPMAGYAHMMLGYSFGLLGRKAEALDAFRIAAERGVSAVDVRAVRSDPRLAEIVGDPGWPFKG